MSDFEWLLRAVTAGLGGWRLALMLVVEDGPWDVFRRLRERAGIRPGEIDGFAALLLACLWCTSVWTATALFLLAEVHFALAALPAAWAVALIADRAARGEQ